MQPSKQEIIDSFKRECPVEIRDNFTDEGLKMILDHLEQDVKEDEEKGYVCVVKSKNLYEQYCEESYNEFIESLKLDVDLTKCQNEIEQQEVLKTVIAENREVREAFIGFTSTHRVVSYLEVYDLETPEPEMYAFD